MTDGDSKPFSATSDHRKEAKCCDQCGSVLPSCKKRFCGQECKDRFVRQKYRMSRDIPADRSCAKCGNPIDVGAQKGTMYCSKKCRDSSYDQKAKRERAKLAHKARIESGGTKTCATCGESKLLPEFYASQSSCKSCFKSKVIEDYRKLDPQVRYQRGKNDRERNPERRRLQHIKDKAKSGRLKYSSHVLAWKRFVRSQRHDAHVKHMKAWKRLPESREWCAMHFELIGKPWLNPHLTGSERYAVRYKIDIEFRLGEINRQTWRKETLKARDDGTINFWQLMRERKTCPYCGTAITKENAVADHMDSVKLGGANSQHNLTICCRSCNKRKAGRPYLEWVDMLPDNRKAAALRWYKRKHGYDPGQDSLAFEFAA